MKSSNIKYLPAVDHLRGYAALLIILYHGVQLFTNTAKYGAPLATGERLHTGNFWYSFLLEGHTAVALFMVLSGFIFTFGCLGKEIKTGGFLWNRFVRTYPLFLLLIFTGI
ncbi:MAG: peptidoglycan/LPS O-acetylase OafA/YrhL, partial [Pirellulaceae bacterium]